MTLATDALPANDVDVSRRRAREATPMNTRCMFRQHEYRTGWCQEARWACRAGELVA